MINLYQKLDEHLTQKYMPLRIMWNDFMEKKEDTEIKQKFETEYIKYLSELKGNHKWKIQQIQNGVYGCPAFPTIYPINL